MDTFANGAANTVSLALAGILVAAVFALMRIYIRQARECAHELGESRADCQWEKQINSELIQVIQKAELALPPITFTQRPHSPSRRARKKGVDDRDD